MRVPVDHQAPGQESATVAPQRDAGDQNASDGTEDTMRHKNGDRWWLRPDGKTRVTIENMQLEPRQQERGDDRERAVG